MSTAPRARRCVPGSSDTPGAAWRARRTTSPTTSSSGAAGARPTGGSSTRSGSSTRRRCPITSPISSRAARSGRPRGWCSRAFSPRPRSSGIVVAALGAAGTEVLTLADGAPVTPRCLSWPDERTELRAIADAVRARLEAEPAAELGVVVPDLDARARRSAAHVRPSLLPAPLPARRSSASGAPTTSRSAARWPRSAPVRAALLALRLTVGLAAEPRAVGPPALALPARRVTRSAARASASSGGSGSGACAR